MKTAALIVAAGTGKQNKAFGPLNSLGSISVAERIVATFHQAGIHRIVMVTGYQAEDLDHQLSRQGVVFLRNPDYEHTGMYDSVKIGIDFLKYKCDRILFTPVNIPLFSSETVKKLCDCSEPLACPFCEGKSGHPILISGELFDRLLMDSGENGLRGALMRCEIKMTDVTVEDTGILINQKTEQNYGELLERHNANLVRPVIHVSIAGEKTFFDEKLALLLNLVEQTGSVRTACHRMQISYSGGWNMIRTMERHFHRHLIQRSQGGAGGGRSFLTKEGRLFVQRFQQFEEELRNQATELFESYFNDFF